MRNIDDLLNSAKKVTGSDNKTAKLLEIPNQLIGNWRGRRSMPMPKHVIAICRTTGDSIEDAILAVEYSRDNERPLRETGFANVYLLAGISAVSLSIVTKMPYELIGAGILGLNTVYYVKCKIKVI